MSDSIDPKAIREALGLTQAQVAEALGLSQARVSRLEADPGKLRPWQKREYLRLAAAPSEAKP